MFILLRVYNILFPLSSFRYKLAAGCRTVFHKSVTFVNSKADGHNVFFSKSKIVDSEIGEGTYINTRSSIRKAKIGKYCSIASGVQMGLGNHPTSKFISTHPAFYYNTSHELGFSFFLDKNPDYNPDKTIIGTNFLTIVGNDVWIGNNAIIIDGVKIGDGAIVAAGAIVTRDVPPYTIVGGCPAKVIKKRFCDNDIQLLCKFQWWQRDFHWLKRNFVFFRTIDLFRNAYMDNEDFKDSSETN